MTKLSLAILALLFIYTNVEAAPPQTLSRRESRKLAMSAALDGLNAVTAPMSLRKSKSANFSGYWHGAFVLASSGCSGFAPSFGFRHAIRMSGNQVAVATTHDGLLLGTTKKGGSEMQAGRTYSYNGVPLTVAVIYRSPKTNSSGIRFAPAGFGLVYGGCKASYGGNSIFAGL